MIEPTPPPPGPLQSTPVLGDRSGVAAWLQYLGYRTAVASLVRLSESGQRTVEGLLAALAYRLDRRHSNAARRFLAAALPEVSAAEREALVRSSWRHLARVVVEDAGFNRAVLGRGLREHFEVEWRADVREALAEGRGGFFVVPHVGMWEAVPAIGVALGFSPAFVVSRPPRNRPLSRYAQRVREARGYGLIHRHGAIERVVEAVRAGAWVGLMLDQRARGKTVIAPFFGRAAHCERAIPVLVRRLARPVVLAACYLTERPFHYRVAFDRVLWPADLRTRDPVEIATALNEGMERLILGAVDQYHWLHDRYRGAPPG